ncbi:hypothetical protein [Sphingomonas sp.]|uniref:hypothetical protein n=1 Tax=Sphingomonas sp. TaxID=28214 RepID=UPI002B7A9D96|nr:hypothetical protein [Sphingomonas sp.]HTG39327.1 hypothetical protein [Sphingomonas sp.]
MTTHTAQSLNTCWRPLMWAGIAALYLVPVIAMLTTRRMAWTGFDFAAAAVLLGGMGLAIELVARTVRGSRLRLVLCAAIVMLVSLLWIEGAVGIFT